MLYNVIYSKSMVKFLVDNVPTPLLCHVHDYYTTSMRDSHVQNGWFPGWFTLRFTTLNQMFVDHYGSLWVGYISPFTDDYIPIIAGKSLWWMKQVGFIFLIVMQIITRHLLVENQYWWFYPQMFWLWKPSMNMAHLHPFTHLQLIDLQKMVIFHRFTDLPS